MLFWLGNDHAHYVVIWKEKTLSDLKDLIFKTIDWIERRERVNELKKKL